MALSIPPLQLPFGSVDVTATAYGHGRPVLLLHGGGGPLTVTPWARRLAAERPVRVITPTHPGFVGTPRPDALDSIGRLAEVTVALIEALDLRDVTVVGSSIGGWLAAELATLRPDRVRGYALVDAVGLEVPGHGVADFFALSPREVAELSYADPDTYGVDPAALPPEARAQMAANRVALEAYAGRTMTDPTLGARLGRVDAPVSVIWGEADRIVDLEVGRAYAAAIPGARFHTVRGAGHLPQIEQPAALVDLVWDLVEGHAAPEG